MLSAPCLLTVVGGCGVEGPTNPWSKAGGPHVFSSFRGLCRASDPQPSVSLLAQFTSPTSQHTEIALKESRNLIHHSWPFPEELAAQTRTAHLKVRIWLYPGAHNHRSWWMLAVSTQVMRRPATKESREPWSTNLNHSLYAQSETAVEAIYN